MNLNAIAGGMPRLNFGQLGGLQNLQRAQKPPTIIVPGEGQSQPQFAGVKGNLNNPRCGSPKMGSRLNCQA